MADTPDDATVQQVIAQCRAVAHMADAIAGLYRDHAEMFAYVPAHLRLTDQIGARTAGLMETLGDILNGVDAVSEEDAWIDPIIAEAQRRWPQSA